MITFDLFYDQFNQEDYYPDEIHVGRYKANSIEELESKIEKLNKIVTKKREPVFSKVSYSLLFM